MFCKQNCKILALRYFAQLAFSRGSRLRQPEMQINALINELQNDQRHRIMADASWSQSSISIRKKYGSLTFEGSGDVAGFRTLLRLVKMECIVDNYQKPEY